MNKDWKITKVSEGAPRKAVTDYGITFYHKVMLEGNERPVSIGKKTEEVPAVGTMVYGMIIATPEFPTDRFKGAKRPFAPGGSPKDEKAIQAMWAISQAIQWMKSPIGDNSPEDWQAVKAKAKELFSWVDEVKVSKED